MATLCDPVTYQGARTATSWDSRAVTICCQPPECNSRRSGTRIAHGFRWAVNRQLRDAVCDFAADSRHASPWAAAIYDDARARGKDHPHAVRITARAWIYVIWRCWHDGIAYDPAKHNALQAILARQQASDTAAVGPGPKEAQ